jgi:hypothetical protein
MIVFLTRAISVKKYYCSVKIACLAVCIIRLKVMGCLEPSPTLIIKLYIYIVNSMMTLVYYVCACCDGT